MVNVPPLKAKDLMTNGLEEPRPTISLCYRDPEGNSLETQVDCFDNDHDAIAFMMGPAFAQNPIGVDFDPEELIRQIESGESWDSLKVRPEVGPRGIQDVPVVT